MIVNKPQFDTENIKVGHAYWFKKKDYRGYSTINIPCIITAVKPLSISVSYWDEKHLNSMSISIDDVVNNTCILEKMIIEGKN